MATKPITLTQISLLSDSMFKTNALRIYRKIQDEAKLNQPTGQLEALLREQVVLAQANAARIAREQAAAAIKRTPPTR